MEKSNSIYGNKSIRLTNGWGLLGLGDWRRVYRFQRVFCGTSHPGQLTPNQLYPSAPDPGLLRVRTAQSSWRVRPAPRPVSTVSA